RRHPLLRGALERDDGVDLVLPLIKLPDEPEVSQSLEGTRNRPGIDVEPCGDVSAAQWHGTAVLHVTEQGVPHVVFGRGEAVHRQDQRELLGLEDRVLIYRDLALCFCVVAHSLTPFS